VICNVSIPRPLSPWSSSFTSATDPTDFAPLGVSGDGSAQVVTGRTRRVSRGLGALRTNLLRTSGARKPIASTEKDRLPEIAARLIGNEAMARPSN
jgi:hypothetical protein